ncbi:MAG: hypothetical protein JEZ00_02950 [Anaerolineaceae bacterium]|nr:hypothetical protein [Anaerolineaceae bacterium]
MMTRDSLSKHDLNGKKYLYTGLDVILEEISTMTDLPEIYYQTLQDGINWQIRSELTVERSILSPGSTYPWVATLMAVGAQVIFPDEARKSIPEFMKKRINGSGAAVGLLIPIEFRNGRMCYQAVRPTPASLPTVSICAFMEMDGEIVKDARIAITGTWRNKLALVKSADLLIGKSLSDEQISKVIDSILKEIEPVTNFQASAEYRIEMAKCLTQRSLSACLTQGEVA